MSRLHYNGGLIFLAELGDKTPLVRDVRRVGVGSAYDSLALLPG